MKGQLIDLSIENHLISSSRLNLIKKYFVKNNAQYLRGIAQNPVTPIELLNELAQVKDIKFAKQIRNYALNNIKKLSLKK